MKCTMIWYGLTACLCGTESTQTLYCGLYCAQCYSETEELVLFTELALNEFWLSNNNAPCAWPGVHLKVPFREMFGSMQIVDFWFKVHWLYSTNQHFARSCNLTDCIFCADTVSVSKSQPWSKQNNINQNILCIH